MTAEIAVMNKHGVALASDSAVTIAHPNGEKVFNSINKLFTLSKYAPIGVMIYGDADFMEVPWEPLLKIYRAKLNNRRFGSVEGYATDLRGFIAAYSMFQDPKRQSETFTKRVAQYYAEIGSRVNKAIRLLTYQGRSITSKDAQAIADLVIKQEEQHLTKHKRDKDSAKALLTKHKKLVPQLREAVFQKFPLTRQQKARLSRLVSVLYESDYLPNTTGVVVSGYGEDEIFPSLVAMTFDGVYGDKLRHTSKTKSIDDDRSASLMPFAQSEMVATFMQGIDPDLEYALEKSLSDLFADIPTDAVAARLNLNAQQRSQLPAVLKDISAVAMGMYRQRSREYQSHVHVEPVTAALAHLPKEELAELAESLVHLTSLKRRVALDTETVGGPIDVAVISKGDGFIWLKRKHYFKTELNPYFIATYYNKDHFNVS